MVRPNRNTKTKERRQRHAEIQEGLVFMFHERLGNAEQDEREETLRALDCYYGQTCESCKKIQNSKLE